MKKNRILFKIALIASFIILFGLIKGNSYGAWSSYNISGMDSSKYPGYKDALLQVLNKHPNWKIKLYYTGLDWDSVLNSEYSGHKSSPLNLIQDTYSGDWICSICQKQKYDVSQQWYCASKQAIAYMMDPRNSFSDGYIFQFQDLNSSVGDREAVKKMTQGTFLYNDSYIDAIMESAQKYKISPFHIVARLRQEQGVNGNGDMNGYVYKTPTGEFVKVYNLYNINVSGNNKFEGLENGAKYAYEKGWFTPEKSIIGGAEFLKKAYINKGQTTLYFQKFDVIEEDGLYNHQYMQNVRAANDEGNTTYNAYNSNGIVNSAFEFTIPVYENMPSSACERPLSEKDKYCGDISSAITEFKIGKNSNNAEYISGQILIIEWIKGNSTVPRTTPKLTIESTDGTIKQELYVKQVSGNTYYFDKYINELDKTKRYIIKAELTEQVNISNNKAMTVKLENQKFSNSECYIKNNYLILGKFKGDLTNELHSIETFKTDSGLDYMKGSIMAIEWINGNANVPSEVPKIKLVSTDGSASYDLYVKYDSNNDYYFDICLNGINKNKQYNLKIELTEENNNSNSKVNTITIPEQSLGTICGKEMYVKDNKLAFKYEGSIETSLKELKLNVINDASYYISGKVQISELIQNKKTIPETLPKLTIESTDGTEKLTTYIKHDNNDIYYFDCYINGLNKNKEYNIYAELTENSNIGTNKRKLVNIPNYYLGTAGKFDIVVNENKLKYQYKGELTTELEKLVLEKNSDGSYHFKGQLMAIEWVNGKSTVPEDKPKILLESTDGSKKYETAVTSNGTNTYYFDIDIKDIDKTKNYNIKTYLTTKYNISNKKEDKANISKINSTLGEYGNYSIHVKDNYIYFKDESYIGNINSELYQFNVGKQNGATYVSGEIVVVEWVDGKSTVPEKKPKMRFKSIDGKVNMEVYVTATGTNTYYFDRYIEGIDTSKEYYFEIESGDSRNVSENRKMNVYYTRTKFDDTIVGKYHDKKIRLKRQKIIFEEDTYVGNINSELYQFNVGEQNGATYVSGEIVVVEWVDGKSTVPEEKPKMRFKSTDGKVNMEVYVTATGTNTYYFDRYIEGIDTSKEYYFEIESGDSRNISPNRKMNVYFSNTKFNNTIVGKYHNKNIRLLRQNIKFE